MTAAAPDCSAWARPELAERVLHVRADGQREVALHVERVHTPHQVLRLEATLQALPGLHRLDLDRAAQRLRVSWDPGRLGLVDVLQACAAAGCQARPLRRAALDDRRQRQAHAALKRLLVAGLFAMQAMMFAFVLYLGHFGQLDALTRELFRWLSLLAAAPVLIWAAQPFYRRAVADLRCGRSGTETVVTVAVLLICAGSLVAIVRGGGEVYFESVSMLVFVLLLGRWLEMRARHRNGALGEAAADSAPVAAQRRRAGGALEWVAVDALEVGDHVHVAAGSVVPADGHVLGTRPVQLDEALLSGESEPVQRGPDQTVAAGSMVLRGPLEMRVDKPAADSALAVLETLAQGAAQDAGDARGDRMASRFALRVLALTGLTALWWLWFDPSRAFEAAIAVLVVACPCAFALAAPVVASRAMGLLGHHGIWVTRPSALARLARIDHAVLDKTGTLTAPEVDVAAVASLRGHAPGDLLQMAGALARESRHPLARTLSAASADLPCEPAQDVEVVEGGGIRGVVGGRELRLGRAGFVSVQPVAPEHRQQPLLLADDDGLLGVFPLRERLRPEVPEVLAALAADGVQLEIASGDAPARVQAVAERLGIDQWHARQTPEDKLQRLAARRQAGARVLAVGDGSNDAPLLAAADVSAALVDGTALARAHADMLLTDGPAGLLRARRMARAADVILRQNRRGALIYNLCAVPFAAAGLVPPWLAVIGMSASSLCVVLNALRLRDVTPATEPDTRATLRPAT